jgi:hypothetical protein
VAVLWICSIEIHSLLVRLDSRMLFSFSTVPWLLAANASVPWRPDHCREGRVRD